MTKEKPNSARDPYRTPQVPAGFDPDLLAVRALAFIAADPERLGAFLAETGLDPAGLRQVAASPGFGRGVLGHVMGHEALLLDFAGSEGIAPEALAQAARRILGPEG